MMVLDKNDPNYRQCSLSVMDNISDPDITFDENGICNYYYEYLENINAFKNFRDENGMSIEKLVDNIKVQSKGNRYDCVIGISGGIDSAYLAIRAHEWGLNPLLVHFDNGWNSELSVVNIEKIKRYTNFDLYTYIVNWSDMRQIQKAYLESDVIDIEAITDLGYKVALDRVMNKFKINIVLDGQNIVSEGVLPKAWICKSQDNLINILKRNFIKLNEIKSYPVYSLFDIYKKKYFKQIKTYSPLNLLDYNNNEAINFLISKIGFKPYEGKHFESIFTRFYQGVILPEKFFVDKRKAHLSNLIFSNQITREKAKEILKESAYPESTYKSDFQYVCKKLEMSEEDFRSYLSRPSRSHESYGLGKTIWESYPMLSPFKPVNKILKILLQAKK